MLLETRLRRQVLIPVLALLEMSESHTDPKTSQST